jgi:hypothetical protein
VAKYFFKSSILWRDFLVIAVAITMLIPVTVILSYDVARWNVVKNVGYRVSTNALDQFIREWSLNKPDHQARESRYSDIAIQIGEKKLNALMDQMPGSMKIWQKGSIEGLGYSGGIKLRLGGDSNPNNFLFQKKVFRIKLKKDKQIFGVRKFILKPSKSGVVERQTLGYLLAESLGILAPLTIPVNLRVDGVSYGVYILREVLDERFLRNRNLLPGEIYKGDRTGNLTAAETKIYPLGLFNHIKNWKKLAINNRILETDFGILLEALSEIWESQVAGESTSSELESKWAVEAWARYAVFETIMGHTRQDTVHNQRLLYDDQLGKIFPIVWDYETLLEGRKGLEHLNFDSANPILVGLFKRDEFRETYLKFLAKIYSLLDSNNCAFPALCGSLDASQDEILPINAYRIMPDPLRSREELNRQIGNLIDSHLWETLSSAWLGEVKAAVAQDSQRPTTLEISDRCLIVRTKRLGAIDQIDLIGNSGSVIPINLTRGPQLLGPRFLGTSCAVNTVLPDCLLRTNTNYQEAGQSIFYGAPDNIELARVSFLFGQDFETDELGEAPRSVCDHVPETLLTEEGDNIYVIGPGPVRFFNNMVFHSPVRIVPDTSIELEPGASLIFKNRVEMSGTEANPIVISGSSGGDKPPWGVVALVGLNTSGSYLKHVRISGGGTARHQGVVFLGMLSIHNSSQVLLENVELSSNKKGDDALHLVYVRDSIFRDITVKNALSDAIDIDIATDITFDSLSILKAGNDCLDFMTSSVSIVRASLSDCGDKAVSAGERSMIMINGAEISRSVNGVVAKDESIVGLFNVQFQGNIEDMKEARKNLHYRFRGKIIMGGGGVALIEANRMSKSFYNLPDDATQGLPKNPTESIGVQELPELDLANAARPGYVGVFAPFLN